jgi:cytoskeletal protein RodZ
MPVSMLVKCEKCGYENFPQHRYCGMCAAELRLPGAGGSKPAPPLPRVSIPGEPQYAGPKYKETVSPPKERKEVAAQPVSGPSFLGLGNEPTEKNLVYLLEDDTPSHRGRNLILILLIAGVAAAAWHWRQDVRVVAERFLSSPPPAKVSGSDSQEANPPAAADSSAGAAPASSANAGAPAEKPGTGANTQTTAAQTPPSVAPAPASGTADATQPTQTQPTQTQPAQSAPPDQSQAADAEPAAPTAKPDESEEAAPSPRARARKTEITRAQRAAAEASHVDDLEAQGEKYLYGNGVPENCARARTNLLAAAQHSNAQAQSVLGTMYATGHCATRDLPTAYRWFGRSLRQDPKNSRIEQDLRVLWNQMTPDERQLALRDVR